MHPTATADRSTTRTIDLLPREKKNGLFALVAKTQSLDVVVASSPARREKTGGPRTPEQVQLNEGRVRDAYLCEPREVRRL